MTIFLQDAHHIALYSEMCLLFSDIDFSQDQVDERLKQAIIDCDHITIDFSTVKSLTKRYFRAGDFRTKEEKESFKQIKLIFQTLCVLIVSKKPEATDQYFKDVCALGQHYPIGSLTNEEQILLLRFRNSVIACLCVIEARFNKQTIIDIAGRLEGTQRKYITGTGQRNEVKIRVDIYEREGKITPEERPYRRLQGSSDGSASPTSSISSFSPQNNKRKAFFEEAPKKVRKQEKLRPGQSTANEIEDSFTADFIAAHAPNVFPDNLSSLLPSHPTAYYGNVLFSDEHPPAVDAFTKKDAAVSVDDVFLVHAEPMELLPAVDLDLEGGGFTFSDMSFLNQLISEPSAG